MPKRDPDSFKMIFQDWVDFEVSQRLRLWVHLTDAVTQFCRPNDIKVLLDFSVMVLQPLNHCSLIMG